GAVTLSGSLIATAKLSGKMKSKPTVLKNHSVYNFFTLLLTVLLVILITAGVEQTVALSVLAMLLTLFFGVLFTIRVGGADMPVTISLLNSLSGLAGAISGFAINNPLLVAVGSVVGASGLILTQIMCKA
ncbi:MAG TPA: NADP transhydrogenase subunit beta, partial [Firmicutes bacterium]|nr:NADP transhydrogenase subunit beta [Bacillota bacterium]